MATVAEALGLAVRHIQAGQWDAAEHVCRAILAHDPQEPDALHLLGLVAKNTGRAEQAVDLMRRSLLVRPAAGDVHRNLGHLLKSLGRPAEALDAFRAAAALNPDQPETLFSLAVTLHTGGAPAEAIPLYERLLGRQPDHLDARYNLGVAYQNTGRLDDAVATYGRVIAGHPDHASAHSNLSATLRHQGRLAEAVAAARAALALDPQRGEAFKNLAFALLLQGDYAGGLEAYEGRRLAVDGALPAIPRPEWDGSPLQGRTILLLAEQGLGDTMHMIRYAPLVKARGGRVIFACPEALVRLLKCVDGIDLIVPRGQPVPAFDVWAPLMSLPRLFGTRLDTIPAPVPYVTAEPDTTDRWRSRMAGGGPRIGLVWAGNPAYRGDALRSHRLASFLPLMAVPGVRFFGLQVGPARREIEEAAVPPTFTDLAGDITDFADTAAIIANLDLVISVDTSVAHLAGAMGKPVWILLPPVPDWRWLMARDDSPWYPTARLFRRRADEEPAALYRRLEVALRSPPKLWIKNYSLR